MQVLLILICTTCEWHYCILGSQASRKVLEDWAAVDSDVDDVAESLSNRTSSGRSKRWTVTTLVTAFFITIWTFITVSYSRTVDIVYRLVGRRRGADIYATPRRKLTLDLWFISYCLYLIYLYSGFWSCRVVRNYFDCFVMFNICQQFSYQS